MGRDLVSARVDGGRAAVREARRSLRPQARPPVRARALPRRLGAVRAGAEHAAADRVQSDPGARRRRFARRGDGRRRRPCRASRPRPLPGPVRRRVRHRGRRRSAARRLLRRQPLLAVDLLRQPAARPCRAGGDRDRFPLAAGDDAAPDRLARHDRPRGRAVRRDPLHQPRRHELRLGRAGNARGDRRRRCAARAVPARRGARRRADPAAGALSQHDVQDDERDRIRRRIRALRLRHLRSALPADRQGPQRHRLRAADDADDARRPRHLDGERLPDLPLRALPRLSDRRHGDRGRRAVPALDARGCDVDGGRGRLHAAPRSRPRARDAGARARRAERGRLPPARRRHLRLDAVQAGRRLDRRLRLRRDLHESAWPRARTARPARRARGASEPRRRPPPAARDPRALRRGRRRRAPSGLPHRCRRHARRVRPELAAARRAAARDGGIGRTRSRRTG